MEKIGLSECKPHAPQFQWGWDVASRAIVSLKTSQCLAVHKPREFAAAQLEPCGGRGHQAWVCSKKGHLTLQGLGLHLSVKQGGQKAFLSREKDKFSRWKTWLDEIICTADSEATRRLGYPTEQTVVPWEWMPQSKTIPGKTITSPETPTATTSATQPWETEHNITSALPSKEEMNLEPEEEKHPPGKQAGNQKKLAGARSPGTNWKTVMLVLSPLAFILGMIILALNIHYNKKKKRLSGLESYPETRLGVSFEARPRRSPPLHQPQDTDPAIVLLPAS
ncbi:uncharacterized protein LOC125425387, partial [Sphaerodactylus townsendi]|uniref:uncharacterized protein LOC125425387 n=1 Tax=Sphaerodactylus townsendi TaxID=933632 RepID=UPI0020273030